MHTINQGPEVQLNCLGACLIWTLPLVASPAWKKTDGETYSCDATTQDMEVVEEKKLKFILDYSESTGQLGTHKTHTKAKMAKTEPEDQERPELERSGPILSHWNYQK